MFNDTTMGAPLDHGGANGDGVAEATCTILDYEVLSLDYSYM